VVKNTNLLIYFAILSALTIRLIIRHVIRNQSIGESLGTYGSSIAANRRKIMHATIDAGERRPRLNKS